MNWSTVRKLGAGMLGPALSLSLGLAPAGPAAADYRQALAALESGDLDAATEELRRAGARDDPSAQYLLGFILESGAAGERDYAAAAQSYRRAAERDLAEAQAALARLYADGRGVKRDWREAARWYGRAADQGHGLAQNDLAILHADGLGVERDPERARELLELAVANLPAGSARNQALRNLRRLRGEDPDPGALDEAAGAPVLETDAGPSLWSGGSWLADGGADQAVDVPLLETEAGPDRLAGSSYLADTNARSAADEAKTRQTDGQRSTPPAVADSLAAAPALAAPADPASHCVSNALARLSAVRSDASGGRDPQLVERAQRLLAGLGYDAGPADGLPGPSTVRAVCRFEMDHSWVPTGEVSERLVRGLSLITEARRASP